MFANLHACSEGRMLTFAPLPASTVYFTEVSPFGNEWLIFPLLTHQVPGQWSCLMVHNFNQAQFLSSKLDRHVKALKHILRDLSSGWHIKEFAIHSQCFISSNHAHNRAVHALRPEFFNDVKYQTRLVGLVGVQIAYHGVQARPQNRTPYSRIQNTVSIV